VIVIVSVIVFLLVRAMPGDPVEMIIYRDQMTNYTPEMIEALKEQKGLNGPLPYQYVRWLGNVLHGDFGKSISYGFDIGPQMKDRLVITLIIGFAAFFIGLIVGPILGLISAIRRGGWIDDVVTVFANVGITAPQFWVAIVCLFLFSVKLGWLPMYGFTLPWDNFSLSFRQAILPVFVSCVFGLSGNARQMRSSVLETLGEDYIRTAWAKGLNERKVLLKHVIKNSLLPIVAMQGISIRMIFGGSVIVETVFVVPGMGKFMVDAMNAQDFSIIQAVTLVLTVVIVLANLAVDLLYGWLDPRIQYGKGGML
jgi:peptide/nickel transport system permease protein